MNVRTEHGNGAAGSGKDTERTTVVCRDRVLDSTDEKTETGAGGTGGDAV